MPAHEHSTAQYSFVKVILDRLLQFKKRHIPGGTLRLPIQCLLDLHTHILALALGHIFARHPVIILRQFSSTYQTHLVVGSFGVAVCVLVSIQCC